MSASTRSRLMMCVIVGLITLPVEALLLPVARTPDPAAAATAWSAGLGADELREAAATIDAYPTHYRRAIMTALSPADRSDAWRAFLAQYLASHQELTAEQSAVVREAMEVITPEAMGTTLPAHTRQRISEVFAKAQATLGATAANELFVTLGPKELARPNALPITQQLADRVRSWRVVNAEATDCNCNIEIDTCDLMPDPWLKCSELYTCEFDLTWPMCGPLWSWACTGWCKIIRFPWEDSE